MWLSGFWGTWQSMRMWMPWNPRVRSGTTSGLLPSSLVGRSSLNFCWSTWTRCWWDFWATNWSYWCSTPCRSLMALESKLLSWNGPLRLTCLESGFDGVVFFSFPPIFTAFYWGCVFGCVLLLDISVKQQKHTETRIVLEIGAFCMYWHCRCCLSCCALRQCHGCDRTSNHQPMEGTWLIEWHPDLLHSQALAFQKAWFCLDPVGWNCLNLTNCIHLIAVVD